MSSVLVVLSSTTHPFPLVPMCRVTKPAPSRRRVATKSHVELILRVKQYFEMERSKARRINLNHVLQRTMEATGFGRTICSKIKTEQDVIDWPHEDGMKVKCTRESSVPNSYISIVRQVVRDILLEKVMLPTIDEVYSRISALKVSDVHLLNIFDESMPLPPTDSLVWTWSRSTLYEFMKASGFIFGDRVSYYEVTKQREDVVSMRDNYLEWIKNYRDKNYEIYYQDETWVFKNMTSKKVWNDTAGDSTKGILKATSGSGERSILSHVISETSGLLEGCMLLYRGSKSNQSADYHSEMNWDVFSHWCNTKVFPAIQARGKKAVLVLDRATYHTKLDEEDRRPVTSWNKKRLTESILRWGGPPADWPEHWRSKKTKAQLLEFAKTIYPSPKYKIQKLADEFASNGFDIKILFLPVAHPELNPIEMVWSFIKRKVASRNLHFNLTHVENETKKHIAEIAAQDIKKYVSHAKKEEDKYRNLAVVVDADGNE